MSLSALLDRARTDPALAAATASVDAARLTLSGPAALQPFAIAALAAHRTHGARGHQHRPRGRGPGRGAALPAARRTRSRSTRAGRRCRTSGSRRAPTRSASGWPCCAGWPTRRPTTRPTGPLVGRRRAGALGAAAAGARPRRARRRSSCTPATTAASSTDIVTDLVAAGYARTELVEKRGDFAVRGGILDVFPPTEEHPLRVEFWGDEVEEIRYFKVADQRSLEVAEHGLWAPPCRELLLTADVQAARRRRCSPSIPELAELLDPISRGEAVEGMEALAPVLVDELTLVLRRAAGRHARRRRAIPERVRTRAADLVRTSAGVPRRVVGRGGRRRQGAGRPRRRVAARPRRRRSAEAERARPAVVGHHRARPTRGRRRRARSSRRPAYRGDTEAALADLHGVDARRLAGRARLRRPRLGPARRRAARRGRDRRPGWSPTPTVEPGVVDVTTGRLDGGLVAPDAEARLPHRGRPHRPARLADQGHQPACRRGGATRSTRSQLQARRLRRARAARRRQVRRDGAPHRQRRRARVPDHRVRAVQARPAGRPAVRPDRLARPGHQVRRRRGAVAVAPRRRRLGQDQGPRPQGGQGDRGRADPALQRADGDQGPRVRARTRRGSASSRTPSPTSRRPTSWPRSTRSRPTWRSRSRWTASSAATSATARPRSRCGPRSRRCRTASRSPCSCRRRCWRTSTCRPSPSGWRSSRSTIKELSRFTPPADADAIDGRHRRRHGRHRHRHAPAAAADRPVQGPRPGDRRRGAALRRRAQGVPQGAAHRRSTC